VNVDIAALRAIERDKDIPFETVLEAIETALLTAYKHTEGHQVHARVDIDRKTGVVRVLAHEEGPGDESGPEWDDTP
jgi:transcription termination/antitermination protein NusA